MLLTNLNRSQINSKQKRNNIKTIGGKCATCDRQMQPTSPSSFVQSFGADVDKQKDGQGILGDDVGSCRPTAAV